MGSNHGAEIRTPNERCACVAKGVPDSGLRSPVAASPTLKCDPSTISPGDACRVGDFAARRALHHLHQRAKSRSRLSGHSRLVTAWTIGDVRRLTGW